VLSAEQSWQQALINLAQARANRFADSAALFMALGGGWWNRTISVLALLPLGFPLSANW
jgi:outer membrane protein TolC